jgi:hypothetical protein
MNQEAQKRFLNARRRYNSAEKGVAHLGVTNLRPGESADAN